MSVEVETCHIVVMNDEEMEVLKLMGLGLYEMRELPPHPTEQQTITLLTLMQRILEM